MQRLGIAPSILLPKSGCRYYRFTLRRDLASDALSRYSKDMRATATLLLLLCALVAAAVSFLSDDGFSKLTALNKNLEQQERTNQKLSETVQALNREVKGLQSDPRTVEKAARSELGMAKPGEMIVIFEKKDGAEGGKSR